MFPPKNNCTAAVIVTRGGVHFFYLLFIWIIHGNFLGHWCPSVITCFSMDSFLNCKTFLHFNLFAPSWAFCRGETDLLWHPTSHFYAWLCQPDDPIGFLIDTLVQKQGLCRPQLFRLPCPPQGLMTGSSHMSRWGGPPDHPSLPFGGGCRPPPP